MFPIDPRIRSHKALASRTLPYSSKPMLAHGALCEVPVLMDDQLLHLMAKNARNLLGQVLSKQANANLI